MDMRSKKGFGVGTIKYALITLIFVVVFLSMLPNLIHQSATSVQTLSTEYGNSTLYGSGASTIGTQLDDWTGYFWVIGPLIMIIVIIMKIFRS